MTWFLRFKWSVSLSLGSWNLVVPETFFTETEAKEAALRLACDLAAWVDKEQPVGGESAEQKAEPIEQETLADPQARCAVCGTPCTGRRYCSKACRQRAYRQRVKERVVPTLAPSLVTVAVPEETEGVTL